MCHPEALDLCSGAREEVRARNREALYALSRTFERCAGKRARRSGAAERPIPPALLDPAAPAEPPSDACAPGAAVAEPDAGRCAPEGEAPPSAGAGHAAAAQSAAHEFTLRPLDSRLVHARRLGQAAAAAPDLAPSTAAGEPAAGEAQAAALPHRARPQRRRADAGAAGPLSGGTAGKAVLGSKRKAAGAHGEAVTSGVGRAAREAQAEQATALAGGRDARAAAATLPVETPDEGAGGAPVAATPKLSKKKRRAQAKAAVAAGAAGAAAGTALTGGAGGAPGAHNELACGSPAEGGGAPASPAPDAEAPRNASGAEAPAAEAETPETMKGAAGLAGGGVTAAAAAAAACKKRVKFALSRNLAHTFGAPAPPPAVRTPPGAQPKGSALKHGAEGSRVLGSAPGRLGGGGAGAPGAGSGQSRLGGKPGGTARRLAARSPKSLPRAQAAQFF